MRRRDLPTISIIINAPSSTNKLAAMGAVPTPSLVCKSRIRANAMIMNTMRARPLAITKLMHVKGGCKEHFKRNFSSCTQARIWEADSIAGNRQELMLVQQGIAVTTASSDPQGAQR